MRKIKILGTFLLILIGLVIISTIGCKKDDDSGNQYNGKTSAVFNSQLTYGTVTDVDGNIYKTIKIGEQTWMAENLRTTKYNDGTMILNITNRTEWDSSKSGAYCNYNNTLDIDTISTYGRLYNSASAKTGKLAPVGWHVPTDADWSTLTHSLGDIRDEKGIRIEGGRLKESGTKHWISPNTKADNNSGFTALPSGGRFYSDDKSFDGIGKDCGWWSSSGGGHVDIYRICLEYDYGGMSWDAVNLNNGEVGAAIRCIRDN